MAGKAGGGRLFQVDRLDMRIADQHAEGEVVQIRLQTDLAAAALVAAVEFVDEGRKAGFFVVGHPHLQSPQRDLLNYAGGGDGQLRVLHLIRLQVAGVEVADEGFVQLARRPHAVQLEIGVPG